jgi:hypothetical protein
VPNTRGKATNSVPTLLYFHGNAGSTPRTPSTFSDQGALNDRALVTHTVPNADLSFRLPNVKHLVATVGTNVLIVSYRGCVLATVYVASYQIWC